MLILFVWVVQATRSSQSAEVNEPNALRDSWILAQKQAQKPQSMEQPTFYVRATKTLDHFKMLLNFFLTGLRSKLSKISWSSTAF